SNFVKATISWVILACAFGIVFMNLFVINLGALPFSFAIKLVNVGVLIQLVFVSIYIFHLIARVEIAKTKDYFLTSFKLANKHFLTSFLSVGVLVGTLLMLYYMPIYILIAISVAALLLSKILTAFVMKKYFNQDALDS
ncbi:MAG: hypothetical protein H7X94_05380, partial [Vallitaleaceae bacterium]|nr:hypothetical protein [Vallitaleaceae bacterium]